MAQIRRPPIKAKKQFPRRSSRDPEYDQVMGVQSHKPLDKQIREQMIPEPKPIDIKPDPTIMVPPAEVALPGGPGLGSVRGPDDKWWPREPFIPTPVPVKPGRRPIRLSCEICRGMHSTKQHWRTTTWPRRRPWWREENRPQPTIRPRQLSCWEMQKLGFDVMCLPEEKMKPRKFDSAKPPKNKEEWLDQWREDAESFRQFTSLKKRQGVAGSMFL